MKSLFHFLLLDDHVVTENIPEKLEVFRGEKTTTSHFTEPEATETLAM